MLLLDRNRTAERRSRQNGGPALQIRQMPRQGSECRSLQMEEGVANEQKENAVGLVIQSQENEDVQL